MAPNFFQKLARATAPSSRERTSSDSIRSTVPNIVTTRPDDDDDYKQNTAAVQHQSSFDSTTQPNVTIVPPSPLAANRSLDSDFEDDDHHDHQVPATAAADEDGAPTPTVDNMNNNNSSSLVPGSFLRKQTSNKSLKNAPPTELQINTETTATTEEAVMESPTELQPPISILSDPPSNRSMSPPTSLGLQPETTTTSMLSLASSDTSTTNNNKKRPWKRSTTRKPTGLASAIAASGLTIANPTLSSAHSAHAAAQISPPPTIPNTPPLPLTASSSQKSGKSSSMFLGNGGRVPSSSSTSSPAPPGSPPYLSRSPPAAYSSSVSLLLNSRKNRSSSNLNNNKNNNNPDGSLSPKSNKSDGRSSRNSKQRGLSPAPPPPPPLPPTGGSSSRSRRSSRGAKSDAGRSEYSTTNRPTSSTSKGRGETSLNGDFAGAGDASRYPEYFELDADTSSSSGSAGSVGQLSDNDNDEDADDDNNTNNTNTNDDDSRFSVYGHDDDNENNENDTTTPNDVVVDNDDFGGYRDGKHGSGAGLSGAGGFGSVGGFGDIPVTGFAVASTKRNQDFHELFQSVPEGDYLIEDYGCALQREILIQGRIYISENHICFHANIFGWITDLSIPVYEITSVEKKMTAFVIPNAIQITTRQTKYTFTSFLARDTTFDVLFNIWRLGSSTSISSSISSGGGGGRPSAEEYSIASALVGGRPSTPRSPPPPSMPGGGGEGGGGGRTANGNGAVAAAVVGANKNIVPAKRATECACGREGRHYPEVAMEIVIPGTPEKINNLIFASGFMKEFMAENQRLLDIQMSDWAPVSLPNNNNNSTTTTTTKLLTRNMSYIKPLAGSLGPKQTKCEIKDEMVHVDFDDFISTVTTTRTPDVPSGGVFAVKNRTCVTWASPVSSKVIVTSQVEWSGRSFIKGIIERSAMDGQRQYHVDLEKAMRRYIQEHQSEFLPEGVEPAAAVAAVVEGVLSPAAAAADVLSPATTIDGLTTTTTTAATTATTTAEELQRRRERERNARGLQWAWDTFEGAYQVGKRSAKGAIELVRDAWDQSSSTTMLWFLIVALVLSNLWTLMRMGTGTGTGVRGTGRSRDDETVRRLGLGLGLEGRTRSEEREKWVQSIVAALWEKEMAQQQQQQQQTTPQTLMVVSALPPSSSASEPVTTTTTTTTTEPTMPLGVVVDGLKEEVRTLQETLKTLEERVLAVSESLDGYNERLVGVD